MSVGGGDSGNTAREPDDVLAGLPPDLARVLRDHSIVVPQDAAVFELIASWANAKSNTMSAGAEPPPAPSETERELLAASVAVWRSIDEREAMPGGYAAQPLTSDTELRKIERAAWERYRESLAADRAALTEPGMTKAELGSRLPVEGSPESAMPSPGSVSAVPAQATPQELAAIIARGILNVKGSGDAAVAALDALLAWVAEAEHAAGAEAQLADESQRWAREQRERAEWAEARVAEAERERESYVDWLLKLLGEANVAERRAERAEARVAEAERGLRFAIEGLDLAATVHAAIDMDTDEDAAVQHRAVATMRLALSEARAALAGGDETA